MMEDTENNEHRDKIEGQKSNCSVFDIKSRSTTLVVRMRDLRFEGEFILEVLC
jgi:hypothetical protein